MQRFTRLYPTLGVFFLSFFFSSLTFAQSDVCTVTNISSSVGEFISVAEDDDDGTTATISNNHDGNSEYIYVTTRQEGSAYIITGFSNAPTFTFTADDLSDGNIVIWGFSYSGEILAEIGDDALTTRFATDCFHISRNCVMFVLTDGAGGDGGDGGDGGGDDDDCEDLVEGGTVSTTDGETTVTFDNVGDGNPDVVMMMAMGVNDMADFTYIVTDGNGMILAIPPANMVDVDGAGPGNCRIYGLSYKIGRAHV